MYHITSNVDQLYSVCVLSSENVLVHQINRVQGVLGMCLLPSIAL